MTDAFESLRAELDVLDDTLCEQLKQVESGLADLRLGVPISLALGDDVLWLDKWGKVWRLMVEDSNGDRTLLCDSPRNIRAKAMQAIPALLKNATTQMQEMVEERKRVVEQTRVVLEEIRSVTR